MGERLIGISMVKTEQDIIEPFLRHHARLLDALVLIDNASVDQTRRIAVDCSRDLGNIIVTDSFEFAYNQSDRMTRILRDCQSAFFADYIFLLDGDEFINVADREVLLDALAPIPRAGVGLMPWRTHLLTPKAAEGAPVPPGSMHWRRTEERPQWYKAVLRLDGEIRPDLIVSQGNHAITSSAGYPVSTVELADVELLHFPVRSAAQLTAKSIVGWVAYLARDKDAREKGDAFQWRDAFDKVVADPHHFTPARLAEAALNYARHTPQQADWAADVVEAALPAIPERRHSDGSFADPFILVVRSWERMFTGPPRPFELPRSARTPAAGGGTALGVFEPDWHSNNFFMDVAPFRYLAERFLPTSVLDIGCGIGAYPQLFRSLGTHEVLGVDGLHPGDVALPAGAYLQHDLAQRLDLGRTFDLVICVEVAAHIEDRHATTLIRTVTAHARDTVIFSAAEPCQPGNMHINCRPIADWLERFAAAGWIPDLTGTLGMRALSSLSWFRRNLGILRRGSREGGAEAIASLTAIGTRPYAWWSQEPGIRQLPFLESPGAC
jgi:SAM-dependent methyltransferase